ncbi:hypothetical protein [Mycolicibacterium agri]|uniref:Uncharacterized protein n=1 Tax=Mycolicibacterium agri TaxID=36811 RepID=A0A7I9WCV4_MYCAG|nr:hypothetical protein [Mycolicibacterium agri]GFG55571.1 hypothetical protein MAGR_70120 [Mycolicibacterium agri]
MDDRALCGAALHDPTPVPQVDVAEALCPDCEARLTAYHLEWWRAKALALTAELEALRAKHPELVETPDTAVAPAPAAEEQTEPAATILDGARRELAELLLQFEGAVPFYRLKNAMQDFSDRLSDDDRLRLAQEIGPDSSLIRWATAEVERRGLSVANNRVQKNEVMMWQEWLQESQPAPKPKRRFGRSR